MTEKNNKREKIGQKEIFERKDEFERKEKICGRKFGKERKLNRILPNSGNAFRSNFSNVLSSFIRHCQGSHL